MIIAHTIHLKFFMMFHGFLCLNMYVFPVIIFYLAPFGWQTLNVVFLFALRIERIKRL